MTSEERDQRLIGYLAGETISEATAWVCTFAREWRDSTVLNLREARKAMYLSAVRVEALRAELLGCPPRDMREEFLAYLFAMKNGPYKRAYTKGLPCTISDEAEKAARYELSTY